MITTKIKIETIIKTKSFDISIGKRLDQIALISHNTDEFTPFKAIKKGGKLDKIKRKFKNKLTSNTHFFFEGLSNDETLQIIQILK